MVDAAVRMILGAYPNRNAIDADAYVTQITALLEGYPEFVVTRCCDPREGIQTKKPFLPSLSEVKEFAEGALEPLRSSMRSAWMDIDRANRASWQAKRAAAQQIEDQRFAASPEEREAAVGRWKEARANMALSGFEVTAAKKARVDRLFEKAQCASGASIRQSLEGSSE